MHRSVMNVVCYEQVCYEHAMVCFEWSVSVMTGLL